VRSNPIARTATSTNPGGSVRRPDTGAPYIASIESGCSEESAAETESMLLAFSWSDSRTLTRWLSSSEEASRDPPPYLIGAPRFDIQAIPTSIQRLEWEDPRGRSCIESRLEPGSNMIVRRGLCQRLHRAFTRDDRIMRRISSIFLMQFRRHF
jgi:hypothetical protein